MLNKKIMLRGMAVFISLLLALDSASLNALAQSEAFSKSSALRSQAAGKDGRTPAAVRDSFFRTWLQEYQATPELLEALRKEKPGKSATSAEDDSAEIEALALQEAADFSAFQEEHMKKVLGAQIDVLSQKTADYGIERRKLFSLIETACDISRHDMKARGALLDAIKEWIAADKALNKKLQQAAGQDQPEDMAKQVNEARAKFNKADALLSAFMRREGISAQDMQQMKVLAGKANALEAEINKIATVACFEYYSPAIGPAGDYELLLEPLSMHDFMSSADYRHFRRRAVDMVRSGEIEDQFIFAGDGTRMKAGYMYQLDLWDLIKTQYPDSVSQDILKACDSGVHMGMAQRAFVMRTLSIIKLLRDEDPDITDQEIKEALSRQNIALNYGTGQAGEQQEVVIADLLQNEYYGNDPDNIQLMPQQAFRGAAITGKVFKTSEKSRKRVAGHGHPTTRLAKPNAAFTVDREGRKHLTRAPVTTLTRTRGVKIIRTIRVNDLNNFTYDVLNMDKLAYALYLVEVQKYNMTIELTGNPGNQKGGNGLKNKSTGQVSLKEKILTDGSVEFTAVIESGNNVPYNAFRNAYKNDEGFEQMLNLDLPEYIRFRSEPDDPDGYYYLESVTGDITWQEGANAAFFGNDRVITDSQTREERRELELIQDCKESKNLPAAALFMGRGDDEMRDKLADINKFIGHYTPVAQAVAVSKSASQATIGRDMFDRYLGSLKAGARSEYKDRAKLITGTGAGDLEAMNKYIVAVEGIIEAAGTGYLTEDVINKILEASSAALEITESTAAETSGAVAIQNGTFNPAPTYSHLNRALTAILRNQGSKLVIFTPGGEVPNELFAAKSDIRLKNTSAVLDSDPELKKWVTMSPVRCEMADILAEHPAWLGTTPEERRTNMDILAMIWLARSNPRVQFQYTIGTGLLSELAEKDSEHFAKTGRHTEKKLYETLEKLGNVQVAVFPDKNETRFNYEKHIKPNEWLQALWSNRRFVVVSDLASGGNYDIDLRRMIAEIAEEMLEKNGSIDPWLLVRLEDGSFNPKLLDIAQPAALEAIEANLALVTLFRAEAKVSKADALVAENKNSQATALYMDAIALISKNRNQLQLVTSPSAQVKTISVKLLELGSRSAADAAVLDIEKPVTLYHDNFLNYMSGCEGEKLDMFVSTIPLKRQIKAVKIEKGSTIVIDPASYPAEERPDIERFYAPGSAQLEALEQEIGCPVRLKGSIATDEIAPGKVVALSNKKLEGSFYAKARYISPEASDMPLATQVCIAKIMLSTEEKEAFAKALNETGLFKQEFTADDIARLMEDGMFELPVSRIDYEKIEDKQRIALAALIAA